MTTPNLPGPVPKATTAISGERVKELRGAVIRNIPNGCLIADSNRIYDGNSIRNDLLSLLDALPALQAEVERLDYLHKLDHSLADQWLACAEKAEAENMSLKMTNAKNGAVIVEMMAELAAARPLLEDAVDYVREHLADHLAALGETTAKNRGRADDMRRIIHAAEAFHQRTERAPAGHEKEKGNE